MNKRKYILAIFFLLLSYKIVYGAKKTIGFAIPFPDLTFRQTLQKEDLTYLGITPGKFKRVFSFREIRGALFLIEYLNIYCFNCVGQAPILNEVYEQIERDPLLKGRVKIIGIAAGNNLEEVRNFKAQHKIPYPILQDPNFDAHQAVGAPRTPFMIWVRKDKEGRGVVVSTHLGLFESSKKIVEETKAVLQYEFSLLRPKLGSIYEGEALKPPLTEEELIRKGQEGNGGLWRKDPRD